MGRMLCIVLSLLAQNSAALAEHCWTKAGSAKASQENVARTEAWEALLQATDWGAWEEWIAGGKKFGDLPGWKVSDVRQRCRAEGGGWQCTAQAHLCK